MSAEPVPGGEGGQTSVTVASQMSAYLRGGGVFVPLLTVTLAFVAGGLVVAATGHNPLSTYKAIFEGSGLNWIFPWLDEADRSLAALNLQQTLIITAPLILVSLAVALAFRAGLFNIGGQGQYTVGAIVAVQIAGEVNGVGGALLAIAGAMAAGAAWAGLAGLLKATTGANEVISTIMLNWTAIYVGLYLFGRGGPWQSTTDESVPISADILGGTHLPVFWGDPELQGLHIGLFIALLVLLGFYLFVNRSVPGYETRAVGFNPDAAEYGGIKSGSNYIKVMALCGLFAGLAGAIDILGWQFRLGTTDIQTSQIGFLGIAVALLGRNTAVGILLASVLFAGLLNGTSVRNLDPAIFDPQLATNLTQIIQGLVVLFVSAPVLITLLTGRLRFWKRKPRASSEEAAA